MTMVIASSHSATVEGGVRFYLVLGRGLIGEDRGMDVIARWNSQFPT